MLSLKKYRRQYFATPLMFSALAMVSVIGAPEARAQTPPPVTSYSGSNLTISSISVNHGILMVNFVGVGYMCGSTTYSFISAAVGESNYDAMVATLLSAYLSKKKVSVIGTAANTTADFCHISWMNVTD